MEDIRELDERMRERLLEIYGKFADNQRFSLEVSVLLALENPDAVVVNGMTLIESMRLHDSATYQKVMDSLKKEELIDYKDSQPNLTEKGKREAVRLRGDISGALYN